MKFLLLILIWLTLLPSHILAVTCTTTAPNTWDCGTPVPGDDLIVNHAALLGNDWNLTGSITVNSGGSLTINRDLNPQMNATIIVNSGGVLTVGGTLFAQGNSSITVAGTLNVILNMFLDVNTSFDLQSGGFAGVGQDFASRSNNVTINSTLAVGRDFVNNGTITGSGTITYVRNCSGIGTINGEDSSVYCDGSGIIVLGSLPIELLFFQAAVVADQVLLTWATASEEGFDFFTIERSADAQEFYAIGTVPGTGFSDSRIDYSFTDNTRS